MISIKIKHKSRLDNIIAKLPKAVAEGVTTALNDTRTAAITAKDRAIAYPDQITDSEIKVEIVANSVSGRVYTDGERVLFVEYGTGTEAELPHVGKTKTFMQSGYTMWLLPVEKAPVDFGATRRVTIGNADFYMMFPTSPTHFFTNTAFNRRDDNVGAVKQAILDVLRGAE